MIDRTMDAARTRALIDELLLALRAEGEVLAAGRDDQVAEAVARKAEILQHLTEVAGAMPAAGGEARAALREARRLNRLNGDIVAARGALHRARRDALFQAGSATALYGARGDARTLRGNVRAAGSA